MLIYCLLVMVFLSKINFNHWLLELLAYSILGIIRVFPSMYILRPFKRYKKMKNNSKEMKLIRRKIDLVDDKLLPLMIKRSKLVEKALDLKKRNEIVDKKRIDEISKK